MMDAPRPQEVCEFGAYRFTINYPPRFPQGDRPLNASVEAQLTAHVLAPRSTESDTPARQGWPDNHRRYTP
jgi:hypothetical protein